MNGAEMCARDDERWRQAQASYVADYDDLSAEVAYRKRCASAIRMYEIEREYKPSLRPATEVLADIRTP